MRSGLYELPLNAHIQSKRLGHVVGARRLFAVRRPPARDQGCLAMEEPSLMLWRAGWGVETSDRISGISATGQFSYCRDCRNAYDRAYYNERGRAARLARTRAHRGRARAWMASLKEGVPCHDCGEVFPVWVMHWDHLPEFEKLDEISVMVGSRTRDAILAELKKHGASCEPLVACCGQSVGPDARADCRAPGVELSGCRDLNPGPRAPKARALPGCATPCPFILAST